MKILDTTLRKFNGRDYKGKDCPASVPDELLNEDWAQHIHGQSLKRLNERGGMSVGEILANINRLQFNEMPYDTPESLAELKQILSPTSQI